MSKTSRTKGANGEREVCKILSDALGETFTRKLGQARDSGNDIDLGPYRVEVKRRKKIAVTEFMEQAEKACLFASGDWEPGHAADYFGKLSKPLVIMREDGEKWLVMQPLEDWIDLYRESIK